MKLNVNFFYPHTLFSWFDSLSEWNKKVNGFFKLKKKLEPYLILYKEEAKRRGYNNSIEKFFLKNKINEVERGLKKLDNSELFIKLLKETDKLIKKEYDKKKSHLIYCAKNLKRLWEIHQKKFINIVSKFFDCNLFTEQINVYITLSPDTGGTSNIDNKTIVIKTNKGRDPKKDFQVLLHEILHLIERNSKNKTKTWLEKHGVSPNKSPIIFEAIISLLVPYGILSKELGFKEKGIRSDSSMVGKYMDLLREKTEKYFKNRKNVPYEDFLKEILIIQI